MEDMGPSHSLTVRSWAIHGPAGDLEHIRTTLRISVSDLARALGVSRQAVYDWRAGKAITPDNGERLIDLAPAPTR